MKIDDLNQNPADTDPTDMDSANMDPADMDKVQQTARSEGETPAAPSGDVQDGDVEILRSELSTMQTRLDEAKTQSDEMKNRYLRARADLENYRRRSAQDLERARESGQDSAVLTVLTVYDDLGRALDVVGDDPGKIIPGVEAVRSGLKRNLAALGIKEVGAKDDAFDPDLHEALSSLPAADESQKGTIAEVFQVGFVKNDRLVRPARVVVYQ